MSVLYLYHVTVQYFPVLDPKQSVFFSYWTIRCKCTLPLFFNDKTVDRKKYPNEKITTSSKRNVKPNKILDRTIRNIYGIVFKRLKSQASFIRCRIKSLTARPIWLFKLCTRPNIFPYCTVKRLITYKYWYALFTSIIFGAILFHILTSEMTSWCYLNNIIVILYIDGDVTTLLSPLY